MKKLFLPLIIAVILQILPQLTFPQASEGEKFVDPNQSRIDSLLNAIKPDSPDSVKAWNYSRVANITCDLDTSLKYSFLSLDYCNETYSELDNIRAYNYNIIAFAYYMRDESRKALQYRFKSAAIYNKVSDKRREAATFIHVGNCYLDLNIKDSVFYYYNKAILTLIEIQDTAFIIDAYNNLGQIYYSMALYDNATENYQKALDYSVASKDMLNMASCYCYLGTTMSFQSDTLIDLAIANLVKSVNLFETKGSLRHYDLEKKHFAYMSLAQAYIKKAKLTGAKTYADRCRIFVEKAANYYKSVGSVNNYLNSRYCYVDYLIFYKRYSDALAELMNLEKYMQTEDHLVNGYQVYYNYLYEVYSHLGDYKNALKYHEKYMEYKMAYVNDSTLNTI